MSKNKIIYLKYPSKYRKSYIPKPIKISEYKIKTKFNDILNSFLLKFILFLIKSKAIIKAAN